jgi:hypothetical protein
MDHPLTISLQGIDVEQSWVFVIQDALSSVKSVIPKFLSVSPSVNPQIIQNRFGPDLYILVASSDEAAKPTIEAIERYNNRYNVMVLLLHEMTVLDGRRQKSHIASLLQSDLTRLREQMATDGVINNRSVYLDLQKRLFPAGYIPESPSSSFDVLFHPELSEDQIEKSFAALADFYRACGGAGFMVEFEKQGTRVPEMAL